jgi:hypothetical protein
MPAPLGRHAMVMHPLLVAYLALPAVVILVVVGLAIPRDTVARSHWRGTADQMIDAAADALGPLCMIGDRRSPLGAGRG